MKANNHEELLAKGFKHDDEDPMFPYCLDLGAETLIEDPEADPEDYEDEDLKLELLVGVSPLNLGDYHLNCGGVGFLSMNFQSVDAALEWAKAITGFEPNY